MGCSLPGSSIHGSFQAIVLEWVAISSSRGYSWPRAQTQVSCIAGRFFTIWAIALRIPPPRIAPDPVASSLCAPDSSGKSRTWLMTGEHTQMAEPNLPAREKPQTWASVPPLAKQEEDSQYMARCTANQEKTHKPKGSATRGSKKCGWGAVRGSQKASESLAGLMEDTSLLTQLIQTGEGEYYFRWEDCNADFKGHEKSRKHDTTKGWQCWQNFS